MILNLFFKYPLESKCQVSHSFNVLGRRSYFYLLKLSSFAYSPLSLVIQEKITKDVMVILDRLIKYNIIAESVS